MDLNLKLAVAFVLFVNVVWAQTDPNFCPDGSLVHAGVCLPANYSSNVPDVNTSVAIIIYVSEKL